MRPLSHKDPHYRHHPKVYSKTFEIEIKVGIYEYKLPQDDFLSDKAVFGFSTRRQSGTSRRTRTGRLIAADDVINSSFLNIFNGSNLIIEDYPLENAVTDTTKTGPGQYDQICLPPNIKTGQWVINIPQGPTLVANTAIEVTLHYMFDDDVC